jgi:hypothetical protein
MHPIAKAVQDAIEQLSEKGVFTTQEATKLARDILGNQAAIDHFEVFVNESLRRRVSDAMSKRKPKGRDRLVQRDLFGDGADHAIYSLKQPSGRTWKVADDLTVDDLEQLIEREQKTQSGRSEKIDSLRNMLNLMESTKSRKLGTAIKKATKDS